MGIPHRPMAVDSPWPNDPVEASRLGMNRLSGWPWYTDPNFRRVFN